MRAETSELFSFADTFEQKSPVLSMPDTPVFAPVRPVLSVVVPNHTAPFPADRCLRFDMAALPAVTRAEQIALTQDQAMADEPFHTFIALADAARDAGNWAVASHEYGNALRLFPLHWGYCVQYAHTVKEQGLHPRAEAWYRSAVALGAPAAMVDEHLAFVARINGVTFVRRGVPDLAVPPMLAPPTVPDIRFLLELTRVPGYGDEAVELNILRNLPDNRAALLRMMGMPAFARTNRAFLDILRD